MHVIDFEKTRRQYERYDTAVADARCLASTVQNDLITAAINVATAALEPLLPE